MHDRFGLLDTDVMPMFMIIALDVFIIMHFSMNCSAVISSPTVIHAILREATSETYGPGSLFIILNLVDILLVFELLFLQSLLSNLYNKIPNIFSLLSLLDLTFASDFEGIDNPFIVLVARFLIVCR